MLFVSSRADLRKQRQPVARVADKLPAQARAVLVSTLCVGEAASSKQSETAAAAMGSQPEVSGLVLSCAQARKEAA